MIERKENHEVYEHTTSDEVDNEIESLIDYSNRERDAVKLDALLESHLPPLVPEGMQKCACGIVSRSVCKPIQVRHK